MDPVSLANLQLSTFLELEWDLNSILRQADKLGLGVVEQRVGDLDDRRLRIELQSSVGFHWSILAYSGSPHCLRSSLKFDKDTYLISNDSYADKLDEFAQAYFQLRESMRSSLGPEEFDGRFGTPGFPPYYAANYITRWRAVHGYLLLSYEEHRRGDPLNISLVALPSRVEGGQL